MNTPLLLMDKVYEYEIESKIETALRWLEEGVYDPRSLTILIDARSDKHRLIGRNDYLVMLIGTRGSCFQSGGRE